MRTPRRISRLLALGGLALGACSADLPLSTNPPEASASETAAASASAAPSDPAPVPGEQLAFLRDRELVILDLETGQESETGVVDVTPRAFVHDWRSVIGLQATVDNPHALRLVRQPLDGSEAVVLAETVSDSGSPSPDGRWLAFGSDGAEPHGIVLVALTTGEATQLTTDGATTLAWSPDSTLIAYERFDPETMQADLHLVEAATGASRQLTNDEPEDSPFGWTDDGRAVLTTSHRGGDGTRLAITVWQVALADGALTHRPELEDEVISFEFPAPDGRWSARITPQLSLRIVGDGLGTGTRLGRGDSGTHLTWAPNSAWLVWTSFDEAASSSDLYMVHAPDGDPIQLTRTPATESHPVWGPIRHGF
ncbi:MAG TPA: hypothetical protein VF365_06320 [Candidatus Limnocylindria bacterium]